MSAEPDSPALTPAYGATVITLDDEPAIGQLLAAEILAGVERAAADGRRYLLGCPGGRSLRPTYRALASEVARRQVDLGNLVIVMMDEYVVTTGGIAQLADLSDHFSCRGFAEREIRAELNATLPAERQMPASNVWMPPLVEPASYDERIRDAGGIDLFLLASGTTDGHVAFNPPGSKRSSITRVVELPKTTRQDNLLTFPDFTRLDDVPDRGLTVGLGTIADLSSAVALVVTGKEKRLAIERLTCSQRFDPDWPASIVHACKNPRILTDRAAATSTARGSV